jgi:hypothetical protein
MQTATRCRHHRIKGGLRGLRSLPSLPLLLFLLLLFFLLLLGCCKRPPAL